MAKFDYLKELDIKGKTAEYTVHQIKTAPTLIMKPATEANKDYFNEVLRRSRRNSRAIKSGNINYNMITENRREDKVLFPKYVIVGWRDQVDSSGKPVEFSVENCQEFIDALPDWIFDEIRAFASDSAELSSSIVNSEEIAGN